MTTRKLLLIFVPAAALLMFALLWRASDDLSMSGIAPLRPSAAAPRDTSLGVLPGMDSGRQAGAIEPIAAHVGGLDGSRAQLDAASALVPGRITGVLVDAAGKPVPREPVLLLLERDPWLRRAGRAGDNERPRQLLASAQSGSDGRFSLEAHAGVRHALLAGGASWARSAVAPVLAGDELRVVLAEGRQLEGSVVDAATGASLANAYVLALAPDDALMVRSDEAGHFRIGPVPDQAVTVGGWAPGFEVKLQPEVSAASGPLTLELAAGREVHGRVLDRISQQPVTSGGTLTLSVDVMARLAGEPVATLPAVVQTATATLDENGAFTFPPGPSMGFDIRTRAEGYVPDAWDRAENRPLGAGDEVLIALWPLGSVAGIVQHDGSAV
ncbi:MAG TPA: carboxypeptidase-like regulatory domain-containing protein, partial [Planctomycetota bacterium]|nr:carboxypeptidase-like regulatory domain-containing protein [Planctomycetota bacterium]